MASVNANIDKVKATQLACEIIKDFEGYSSKAYQTKLANGLYDVPTIGWGTTVYASGVRVKMGDTITKEQAQKELEHEVMQKDAALQKMLKVVVNYNQYASLLSLCYNWGEGNLSASVLLQLINKGASKVDIVKQWCQTAITAKGVKLAGLVRRRIEESTLYATSIQAKTFFFS
jgi:lysozyme